MTKRKCPKDADSFYLRKPSEEFEWCAERLKGRLQFCCTRNVYHEGEHHEHNLKGKCLKVWGD